MWTYGRHTLWEIVAPVYLKSFLYLDSILPIFPDKQATPRKRHSPVDREECHDAINVNNTCRGEFVGRLSHSPDNVLKQRSSSSWARDITGSVLLPCSWIIYDPAWSLIRKVSQAVLYRPNGADGSAAPFVASETRPGTPAEFQLIQLSGLLISSGPILPVGFSRCSLSGTPNGDASKTRAGSGQREREREREGEEERERPTRWTGRATLTGQHE